jgi:hypothetical protein
MSTAGGQRPAFLNAVTEDRGTLLAVDLTVCPFTVRRAFTVSAPDAPVRRGGHDAECAEYILLVRGACTVHLGRHAPVTHALREPGAGCLVEEGTYVLYELETPDSVLLVLAERPFTQGES